MTPIIRDLIGEALATLRDPRAAARWIMSSRMSRADRWLLLALIAVVSAIAAYISFALNARLAGVDISAGTMMAPMTMAVSQFIVMVVMVLAIAVIGQALGGKGKLDDAILMVTWVQTILVMLQLVQIAVSLIFPMLGMLIGLGGIFLLFWLLTLFITEMHGFRSPWAVFFVMLVSSVLIATILRTILGFIGIDLIGMV